MKTCTDLLAEALKQNDELRALLSEVLATQDITAAARKDIAAALERERELRAAAINEEIIRG